MNLIFPIRRHRWLLLATPLIVAALVISWLGYERSRVLRRRAFRAEIEAAGGQVSRRYDYREDTYFRGRGPLLTWVSTTLGDEGPMTTIILPSAPDQALVDRAYAVYPEASAWAYDSASKFDIMLSNRAK